MAKTPKVSSYYKQSKKSAAISKSTTKSSKRKGSRAAVDPLDLQEDEYDMKERILREFDMNMKYGPCIGMTRMARWERADRFGLSPPMNVKTFLMDADVRPECLWWTFSKPLF